jgi:hypothetical protein
LKELQKQYGFEVVVKAPRKGEKCPSLGARLGASPAVTLYEGVNTRSAVKDWIQDLSFNI